MSDSTTYSDDNIEELQLIGQSTSSTVHKVKDKTLGHIMTRKTIKIRDSEAFKQLLHEIKKMIASIRHTNIIHLYDVYILPSASKTEVKIMMEYCEGGSLESIGKRMKKDGTIICERVVGRLAQGILQGLAYLNSRLIIHRNIKPSNILLTIDGIVKLSDFGISRELVTVNPSSMAHTSDRTIPMIYMAPERISGENYTITSDIWSTGITLLELVQNHFPFPIDLGAIDLMMHITTCEPPCLEDDEHSDVQWSNEMKDFIKQTLTKNPSTRPTPEDMLRHKWITNNIKEEVNMVRWIFDVYGWTTERTVRDI